MKCKYVNSTFRTTAIFFAAYKKQLLCAVRKQLNPYFIDVVL